MGVVTSLQSSLLVLFDRTHVISYKSSIATIGLSCAGSEILALISQNFKRSHEPTCTPILQNFNMRNASTLYVQSAN